MKHVFTIKQPLKKSQNQGVSAPPLSLLSPMVISPVVMINMLLGATRHEINKAY